MLLISFNSRKRPAGEPCRLACARGSKPEIITVEYTAFAESADLDLCTLEPDLTNIDGNHQHFLNQPAVRRTRVGSVLGGQMNSVRHDIV